MILEKIKNLITLSDFSQEEQNEFLSILQYIEEKNLSNILDLFKEDKMWIRKIYNNYKIKKQAFANKNKILWAQILEQEKEELTNA